MRLTGFREGRRTIVARRTPTGTLERLAEAEDFWADPHGWPSALDARAAEVQVGAVELVPPVPPSARVICIGLNYAEHVAEGTWERPSHPTVFARWTASLSVSGVPVVVPPDEDGLDWEGELVVVVGRRLSHAEPEAAMDAVFGYAAFNDMTARRAQKLTSQWTLGKNVDHSGPMSDIVTADEVGRVSDGLRLETRVNGETVQSASTSQMLFSVPEVLSFLSRTLTLNPGDVLATGTPSGVGYVRTPPRLLRPGDSVEVEIERIGSIVTPVVAAAHLDGFAHAETPRQGASA